MGVKRRRNISRAEPFSRTRCNHKSFLLLSGGKGESLRTKKFPFITGEPFSFCDDELVPRSWQNYTALRDLLPRTDAHRFIGRNFFPQTVTSYQFSYPLAPRCWGCDAANRFASSLIPLWQPMVGRLIRKLIRYTRRSQIPVKITFEWRWAVCVRMSRRGDELAWYQILFSRSV